MAEHVELMRSLGYRYDVNEGMLLRLDRFLQSCAELAGEPVKSGAVFAQRRFQISRFPAS